MPVLFREAMGLAAGDEVLIRCKDGEVTLYTRAEVIRRAQALVRQYAQGGKNSGDDFLDERRREAGREEAEAVGNDGTKL